MVLSLIWLRISDDYEFWLPDLVELIGKGEQAQKSTTDRTYASSLPTDVHGTVCHRIYAHNRGILASIREPVAGEEEIV